MRPRMARVLLRVPMLDLDDRIVAANDGMHGNAVPTGCNGAALNPFEEFESRHSLAGRSQEVDDGGDGHELVSQIAD